MRDLNQEIAEEIMGWYLLNTATDKYAKTDEDYSEAARKDGWVWVGRKNGEYNQHAWDWSPTGKISDAFELINKLRMDGFIVETSSYPDDVEWLTKNEDDGRSPRWELKQTGEIALCCICKKLDGLWIVYGDASDSEMPIAICKAALAAITTQKHLDNKQGTTEVM